MIPAAVGCILACGTFWRGRPPTPPSAGAETDQEGFFKGLRMVSVVEKTKRETVLPQSTGISESESEIKLLKQ